MQHGKSSIFSSVINCTLHTVFWRSTGLVFNFEPPWFDSLGV